MSHLRTGRKTVAAACAAVLILGAGCTSTATTPGSVTAGGTADGSTSAQATAVPDTSMSAPTSGAPSQTSGALSSASVSTQGGASSTQPPGTTGASSEQSAPSGSGPASSTYGQTSSSAPSSTSSAPPIATTPVPPPSSGNVSQTVPSGTITTKPPVPISASAQFSDRVTVTVARVRAVDVQAEGPGEISGPGLEITVRIVNDTARPLDLGNTIVDLTDSAGDPAVPIASGNTPIAGTAAPGATATGSYQFKIPANLRDPISIAVSYTTAAPVVVFSGKVG